LKAGGHRKAAAATLITMPDQDISTPEVLDRLAAAAMARIVELISDITNGAEKEQGALATIIVGEILARTLAIPDAAFVAEITNVVLGSHKLAWRLVALS
jgi:hypothetical protein